MLKASADLESNDPPPATPVERLHEARYVLVAAAAALSAGSAFWGVPVVYSAAAIISVIVVAAFLPRRRAFIRSFGERRPAPVWPDTSMKATLEAVPHAGFILDAAGVVRYANRRAQELFPATRPGDPFTFTFRWPEIGQAVREAQAGLASAVEYHEPGEATNVYSVSLGPLRVAGQAGNFILVAFDDVSDRLAIARMRSDFVANASHELRTPLASLTGFIETLLGPARNDPQTSEKFLGVMLEQARRMRRLLDDLLSLSRAEMRAHRRPTERVELAPVLRHVADALSPLAREHAVALAVVTPEPPVIVLGDRDELVQVFQNLVENALRYGSAGGRVDVTLVAEAGDRPSAAVHVQDYGAGISAEHLPRLTERFYRVDAGASRQMKGTGLGLAIVKHILTRHQGRLSVESEPGNGARFSVDLPVLGAIDESGPKIDG